MWERNCGFVWVFKYVSAVFLVAANKYFWGWVPLDVMGLWFCGVTKVVNVHQTKWRVKGALVCGSELRYQRWNIRFEFVALPIWFIVFGSIVSKVKIWYLLVSVSLATDYGFIGNFFLNWKSYSAWVPPSLMLILSFIKKIQKLFFHIIYP